MTHPVDNERFGHITWDLDVGGTKRQAFKDRTFARYLHTLHATNSAPASVCEDMKDTPKGWHLIYPYLED